MDDLRMHVEIDDTKRALYMEARRTLKEEFNKYGSAFVCVELKNAVLRMAPFIGEPADEEFVRQYSWNNVLFSRVISDFEEMFPELIELFDGFMYLPDGQTPTQIRGAWFAREMIEARIALIDFILSHR